LESKSDILLVRQVPRYSCGEGKVYVRCGGVSSTYPRCWSGRHTGYPRASACLCPCRSGAPNGAGGVELRSLPGRCPPSRRCRAGAMARSCISSRIWRKVRTRRLMLSGSSVAPEVCNGRLSFTSSGDARCAEVSPTESHWGTAAAEWLRSASGVPFSPVGRPRGLADDSALPLMFQNMGSMEKAVEYGGRHGHLSGPRAERRGRSRMLLFSREDIMAPRPYR